MMTIDRRHHIPVRAFVFAFTLAFALAACSSSGNSPPADGSSPNDSSSDVGPGSSDAALATCGAEIPSGQVCNLVADDAPTIVPTCTTGSMPVGTGGTVVAGTYHFTSQTYYNVPFCPTTAFSGTIVIGGGCIQSSTDSPLVATTSATLVIHGNIAEVSPRCINTGTLSGNPDAPARTFTATPTTL